MKENTSEKGLILVNKNSIVYKIQYFIHKIISRKKADNLTLIASGKSTIVIPKEIEIKATIVKEDVKNYYTKCIKNIEEDDIRLSRIQKQYHAGELEEKLTEEQINTLCDLYNKQIVNLEKLKEEL